MPGMNSGLNISDPTVVAAFRSALIHQGIIALLIFALLSVAWVIVRDVHLRTVALPAGGGFDALAATGSRLSAWRLAAGAAAWARTQSIDVPIQYGSSG